MWADGTSAMRSLAMALVLLATALPTVAQQSVLLVPDVPTDLDGTTYLPWQVIESDGLSYSTVLTLPAGTPVHALHRMIGGDWLFEGTL